MLLLFELALSCWIGNISFETASSIVDQSNLYNTNKNKMQK